MPEIRHVGNGKVLHMDYDKRGNIRYEIFQLSQIYMAVKVAIKTLY